MAEHNFLVEGVSCTGKTSVCHELRRRGIRAFNGDRDLAYQGDPVSGEPWDGPPGHEHHIWRMDQVRALVADRSDRLAFFCGGSRNVERLVDLFDEVFVLTIDEQTLRERLAARPGDEFGSAPEERDLVLRLHATEEDIPREGVRIDATAPLTGVVDELLRRAEEIAVRRA